MPASSSIKRTSTGSTYSRKKMNSSAKSDSSSSASASEKLDGGSDDDEKRPEKRSKSRSSSNGTKKRSSNGRRGSDDDDDDDDGDDQGKEEDDDDKKKKSNSKDNDKKVKAKEDEEGSDDDDDDEDEDEETYEVTKIKDHRSQKNGKFKFRVGWKGYGSEDDSWEPEEHLTGAKELLKTYKTEHGLISSKKNSRNSVGSSKPNTTSKSRGSDEESSEVEIESKKRKRGMDKPPRYSSIATLNGHGKPTKADRESVRNRDVAEDSCSESEPSEDEWHARHIKKQSWEDLITAVRTIDREPGSGSESSKIRVCLLWHTGRTSWIPNSTARAKIPQKLLDFYEQHLQFAVVE